MCTGDLKPKIIGIASTADTFAGSELDRSQVRQFVRLLGRIAFVANSGLVLIAHPSLTGISSGTGLSGSTQWHNAVRARFYLQSVKANGGEEPNNDLRELVYKKSNYGPPVQSIGLQYQNGLFLPVANTELKAMARAGIAKSVFMTILQRFNRENRHVSATPGPNFAPTQFVKEPEAKEAGCYKEELAEAMRVLIKDKHIQHAQYGKPSNPHFKLVCVGEQQAIPF
jgi:RecA-family ATPase